MAEDRIHEIAHDLIGTCQSIGYALNEGEDASEIQDKLAELAFECDGCGWWCSVEELNNETSDELCDDCHRERNPEDD